MDEVKYENERFPGAQLRAVTRIRLAGETAVCVPETKGELDETLWKFHQQSVQNALANRVELLKALTSLTTELLNALKKL
jgi:hypothetical protein